MADKTMSTGSSVEKLLALHCAPALAGVKPSNLFTLHFSEGKPEARELREAADSSSSTAKSFSRRRLGRRPRTSSPVTATGAG